MQSHTVSYNTVTDRSRWLVNWWHVVNAVNTERRAMVRRAELVWWVTSHVNKHLSVYRTVHCSLTSLSGHTGMLCSDLHSETWRISYRSMAECTSAQRLVKNYAWYLCCVIHCAWDCVKLKTVYSVRIVLPVYVAAVCSQQHHEMACSCVNCLKSSVIISMWTSEQSLTSQSACSRSFRRTSLYKQSRIRYLQWAWYMSKDVWRLIYSALPVTRST